CPHERAIGTRLTPRGSKDVARSSPKYVARRPACQGYCYERLRRGCAAGTGPTAYSAAPARAGPGPEARTEGPCPDPPPPVPSRMRPAAQRGPGGHWRGAGESDEARAGTNRTGLGEETDDAPFAAAAIAAQGPGRGASPGGGTCRRPERRRGGGPGWPTPPQPGRRPAPTRARSASRPPSPQRPRRPLRRAEFLRSPQGQRYSVQWP